MKLFALYFLNKTRKENIKNYSICKIYNNNEYIFDKIKVKFSHLNSVVFDENVLDVFVCCLDL